MASLQGAEGAQVGGGVREPESRRQGSSPIPPPQPPLPPPRPQQPPPGIQGVGPQMAVGGSGSVYSSWVGTQEKPAALDVSGGLLISPSDYARYACNLAIRLYMLMFVQYECAQLIGVKCAQLIDVCVGGFCLSVYLPLSVATRFLRALLPTVEPPEGHLGETLQYTSLLPDASRHDFFGVAKRLQCTRWRTAARSNCKLHV